MEEAEVTTTHFLERFAMHPLDQWFWDDLDDISMVFQMFKSILGIKLEFYDVSGVQMCSNQILGKS